MIFLKVGTLLLSGVLFSLGGYHWLYMRRFVFPSVLGISLAILTYTWWIGLTVLPVMITLSLGYKRFDRLGDTLSRSAWLMLQSAVIGCGVLITHHLTWYFYLGLVLISAILGGTLKNLWQPLGDLIFGCWLGIIVFFIR